MTAAHRGRRAGLAALVLAGVLPAVGSAQQAATAPALVFAGVTVIDVTDGRRLPDQTVVIVGNRIQAVGPVKKVAVPKGAQVVEATGKYLLPGFWDMHVHPNRQVGVYEDDDPAAEGVFYRAAYARFIAHGITGIREMAQRWARQRGFSGSPEATDSFRRWQREILAGRLIGPRLIGPSADVSAKIGFGANADYSQRKATPDEARHIIDSLKAAGDAFVKFHGWPQQRDVVFALLAEARRVGLPVVGHAPQLTEFLTQRWLGPEEAVTLVEAIDSGLQNVEHNQFWPCWPGEEAVPDSATRDTVCRPMVQAFKRNGAWVTPTLSYTAWLAVTTWDSAGTDFGEVSVAAWDNLLRFWRTMYQLGLRNFLAGTDWGGLASERPFRPGLSAREELVFLANAGLTPLEALQAGTLNPARFFQMTDSLGTVAPGKLADLVLLDGDPVADITNVLKLWGVVANGRYFDHATLVTMDPEGFTPGVGLVAGDRRMRRDGDGNGSRRSTP